MIAQAINGVGTAVAGMNTALAGPASTASSEAATPFSGMFQSLVDQTSSLDTKASQAVSGLLSGQGVDIHDAMIATEKADMAFELALQVRNKAIGAYQQMMAMQF